MSNAGIDNWKGPKCLSRDDVVTKVHSVEKQLLDAGLDISRLCYLLSDDEWRALNVDQRRHEGGRQVVKIGLLEVRRG
jgi:hypothetical protein